MSIATAKLSSKNRSETVRVCTYSLRSKGGSLYWSQFALSTNDRFNNIANCLLSLSLEAQEVHF